MFQKFTSKYKAEKLELEQKLDDRALNSSNLEKIISKGLKIAGNISELWVSSDFSYKRQLQKLIFPEGILYNKSQDPGSNSKSQFPLSPNSCSGKGYRR